MLCVVSSDGIPEIVVLITEKHYLPFMVKTIILDSMTHEDKVNLLLYSRPSLYLTMQHTYNISFSVVMFDQPLVAILFRNRAMRWINIVVLAEAPCLLDESSEKQ